MKLIYYFSILGTFMFGLCGIALFVLFGLTFLMIKKLALFATLDISRWVILGIGIACIIFAICNLVIWRHLRQLMSKKKSTMVGELIYILGLQYIYDSQKTPSSPVSVRPKSPPSPSTGTTSSGSTIGTGSIMGLGYDDEQLWTYRGKRPYPIKEPTDRDE